MSDSTLAQRSPRASKHRSFLIGLCQMFLMATNIKNMASGQLLFVTGFTLVNTWFWVYLVRTVVHSKRWEVFWYAIGSAMGADLGVMFSHFIVRHYAVTQFAFFR